MWRATLITTIFRVLSSVFILWLSSNQSRIKAQKESLKKQKDLLEHIKDGKELKNYINSLNDDDLAKLLLPGKGNARPVNPDDKS